MKQLLIGLSLISLTFAYSCKDPVATTIEIMHPHATPKNNGDTVHVHVNFIQEDETIDNVSVKIYKTSDQSVELYNWSNNVSTPNRYEHHTDVILDVTGLGSGEYTLEAQEWEETDNIHSSSITFQIN